VCEGVWRSLREVERRSEKMKEWGEKKGVVGHIEKKWVRSSIKLPHPMIQRFSPLTSKGWSHELRVKAV
jgi:hypothetical protein